MAPSLEAQQQLEIEGDKESPPVVDNGGVAAQTNKSKVTVIGSGNWGSVAAKLIASNALKLPSFHDEVRMWVFEETLPNGDKLTGVINKTNVLIDIASSVKLYCGMRICDCVISVEVAAQTNGKEKRCKNKRNGGLKGKENRGEVDHDDGSHHH